MLDPQITAPAPPVPVGQGRQPAPPAGAKQVAIAAAPGRTRGLAHPYRRTGSQAAGFAYVDEGGVPVQDARALARIQSLRIPPAWTAVQISRQAGARIQAVGLDAKGRKQYIYSPRQLQRRIALKQSKLEAFAAALPGMRAITAEHLGQSGLTRERVLATMVRLIDEVAFRAGSARHAQASRTFGISTLERRHVRLRDGGIEFSYRGKHGIQQHHVVADEAILAVIAELLKLRGRQLFKYVAPGGNVVPATARQLNQYIHEVMGPEISAKDFRTWIGTVECACKLAEQDPAEQESRQRRAIVAACRAVADRLGNTASVARASYVDPRVIELYRQGQTIEQHLRAARRTVHSRNLAYEPAELAVMRLLGLRRVGVAPTPPVGDDAASRTA